ncbi:MAG: hypothetical protein QM606_00240 [Leucobacter sp.]
MFSVHSFVLDVLGTPVLVEISGDEAASARDSAVRVWGGLVIEAPGAAMPADARRLQFFVDHESAVDSFLDELSSKATLAGIEARSGELLMLHAAGLADPETGRVVACVAPSGTGKTTLSKAAAGLLRYVTDETVAVTREGAVIRYPKPLSVKQRQEAGWLPKLQRRPESFGLEVADGEGLALGAVLLLRRRSADDEDGSGDPGLEPVELFEAMVHIVRELSYLGRMPEPLHWLAGTLCSVGGVRRLNYREADQAIVVIRSLLGSAPAVDPSAGSKMLERSDDELRRWESALTAAAGTRSARRPFARLGAEIDDLLVDPERGQALVFIGGTVSLISSIAGVALVAARHGLDDSQLRECLIGLFGDPGDAEGDPIGEVVAALLEHGMLVE